MLIPGELRGTLSDALFSGGSQLSYVRAEWRSAMRAWDKVARFLITVNDYYLMSIIRMRRAEVERFEGVGVMEMIW